MVDKKFQAPFIASMLVALLIVVILVAGLIIYSTSREITGSVYSKIVDLKNTKEIILPQVIKISIFIILIVGGIALYNLLKYSNTIVGPMVRYKRCLKALGNGDFTIFIKFREKDKLKDMADLLSGSVKKINVRIKTLKENFDIITMLMKEKGINKLNTKEMKIFKDSVDTVQSILKNMKTD